MNKCLALVLLIAAARRYAYLASFKQLRQFRDFHVLNGKFHPRIYMYEVAPPQLNDQ